MRMPPVPPPAQSSSQKGAAAETNSNSAPGPQLHQHAVLSILQFFPLQRQRFLSCVSRGWQHAVRSTPVGALFERFSALDVAVMSDFSQAVILCTAVREANDPDWKECLLLRWERMLRDTTCMVVAGSLLAFPRYASVICHPFRTGGCWTSAPRAPRTL